MLLSAALLLAKHLFRLYHEGFHYVKGEAAIDELDVYL